jgi:glycine hydroxymethyltransferase
MRIGTSAITTRGMKEDDCKKIVGWLDRIITHHTDDKIIADVKAEVTAFAGGFRLFPDEK